MYIYGILNLYLLEPQYFGLLDIIIDIDMQHINIYKIDRKKGKQKIQKENKRYTVCTTIYRYRIRIYYNTHTHIIIQRRNKGKKKKKVTWQI